MTKYWVFFKVFICVVKLKKNTKLNYWLGYYSEGQLKVVKSLLLKSCEPLMQLQNGPLHQLKAIYYKSFI